MVESFDKTWSTGEGNGKPRQYSCLENPMNSMKKQKATGQVMGRVEKGCGKNVGLPFPSPVTHVLSELSTMTRPSWVALHGMAHSFIELVKAVVHVIRLFSFCACGFQSVRGALMEKDKRLMEAS